MSGYRIGDMVPPVQRSPRVYQEGGKWYFKTREGATMGPYVTREEADQGVIDLIEFVENASLEAVARLTSELDASDEA